jgi:hypothetical protein
MRAYEIHTFRHGVWKVDSVFDDKDLAIYEAKRVEDGSRYSGVKVVEEDYDEVSNLTKTRTLYRGGTAKTSKKPAPAAAGKPNRRGAARGGSENVQRRKGHRKEEKKTSILVPCLILLVVVMAGLTGLLALNFLSQLK